MAHALRYLILACCLALGGARVSGAENPRGTTRFTVFALRPIPDVSYAPATGAPVALEFKPNARSASLMHTGTGPIRFFDGKTAALIAEAAVPAGMKNVLLLFLEAAPANARGLRYQIAVLDDSAQSLPRGHVGIVNLSGLKLTGTLGTHALAITEGLNAPVAMSGVTRLTLFTAAGGRQVQSFSETLRPAKASRVWLILFPPVRKGGLEVQSRFLLDEAPAAGK